MEESVLKYLIVDIEKTLGMNILLLDVTLYSIYEEGIKKGYGGITCTCLIEAMGYTKRSIKIPGILELPFEFDGTPVEVEFDGLEAKVWQDWSNKGMVKLSIKAKNVRPVAKKKINLGGEKS